MTSRLSSTLVILTDDSVPPNCRFEIDDGKYLGNQLFFFADYPRSTIVLGGSPPFTLSKLQHHPEAV
jgi:hypothetical protein